MLRYFIFLQGLVKPGGGIARISIPPACHYRIEPENIEYAPRRDPELLFHDIARTWRKTVRAFHDAGCRYLQLEDIFFACPDDPKQRGIRRAMGQDPDEMVRRYAWMAEQAIRDRPADPVIGMHMCRGDFRSSFVAGGGYGFAAEAIFNRTSVDVCFMEYDTERAG